MWLTNGCPILYFALKYKQKSSKDWIVSASEVPSDEKRFELLNLTPGTVYQLLISAFSEAGYTNQDYLFATLTLKGGTSAALMPVDLSPVLVGTCHKNCLLFYRKPFGVRRHNTSYQLQESDNCDTSRLRCDSVDCDIFCVVFCAVQEANADAAA